MIPRKCTAKENAFLNLLVLLIGVVFAANAEAAAIPHGIADIAVGADRIVTLQLEGDALDLFTLPSTVVAQYRQMFDLYLVESSADLTKWIPKMGVLRTNGESGPLVWRDPETARDGMGFYRARTNNLLTQFPLPSGPFAVGKVSRILNDPSRTNRYDIATNSSFMCTIWYPASEPPAGALPAPYTDNAIARETALYSGMGWPLAWEAIIAACVGQAYTNVPMAQSTDRFPVIIHSHGAGVNRTSNTQVALELASHGYVVAAIDHIDCDCTVFPDARGVRYPSAPKGRTLMQSRVSDMRVFLDSLTALNSSDPILAGRLDLGRIGAMGWSLGGGTAAEITSADDRVKCAALLDPYLDSTNDPGLVISGLQKPFLTMNDTVAVHQDFLPSPEAFSTMSSNLVNLASTNATWVKIANAAHTTFSDWAWTMEARIGTRGAAGAISAATVWFFDLFLKKQDAPFPSNPELVNVRRK